MRAIRSGMALHLHVPARALWITSCSLHLTLSLTRLGHSSALVCSRTGYTIPSECHQHRQYELHSHFDRQSALTPQWRYLDPARRYQCRAGNQSRFSHWGYSISGIPALATALCDCSPDSGPRSPVCRYDGWAVDRGSDPGDLDSEESGRQWYAVAWRHLPPRACCLACLRRLPDRSWPHCWEWL